MIIHQRSRPKEEIKEDREKIKKEIKDINKEINRISRLDFIELEPEDREMYESWNNAIKENKRNFANIAIAYKNESDYLIKKLKCNKSIKESFLISLVCEEKGHIPSRSGGAVINGSYVQEHCKRCKLLYKRNLTQKEYSDWDKLMHTPMNI